MTVNDDVGQPVHRSDLWSLAKPWLQDVSIPPEPEREQHEPFVQGDGGRDLSWQSAISHASTFSSQEDIANEYMNSARFLEGITFCVGEMESIKQQLDSDGLRHNLVLPILVEQVSSIRKEDNVTEIRTRRYPSDFDFVFGVLSHVYILVQKSIDVLISH